jgi:hypothetical protein
VARTHPAKHITGRHITAGRDEQARYEPDRKERQMTEPVETRGDDRVDLIAADTNNDGRADLWVSDTDRDGKPDLFQFDHDGDGVVDTTMVDLDQDSYPDQVVKGDGGHAPD